MKVVRSMLAWWCLLLAAFAAAMALVSQDADKILYLDADRSLLEIKIAMVIYDLNRAERINPAPNRAQQISSRELMIMASDGTLVVQCLEYVATQTPTDASSAQSGDRFESTWDALEKAMGWATSPPPPRLVNVRRFELPLIWTSIGLCACSALLLVPPPLRRAIRRAQNRCVFCGYSLYRLISDRCPECGNPFSRREGTAGSPP